MVLNYFLDVKSITNKIFTTYNMVSILHDKRTAIRSGFLLKRNEH